MMASLIEMVVYIVVALLAVKMVFFRKDQKLDKPRDESVSWKSAVDAMGIMETRLVQLQERDVKLQERVWFLEDQNRDLQQRLSRVTQELLIARPSTAPSSDPGDDDDHDVMNSIPVN